MSRIASTLVKFGAGAIGVLALLLVGSVLMMSYIFREHPEPPISETEAKTRLVSRVPPLASIGFAEIAIDSYTKTTTWDGTTHECWIALMPAKAKQALKLGELLEIRESSEAWSLPAVSARKGRKAEGGVLWTSGSMGDGIVVWPVRDGFLLKYEYTEIRNH